MISLTDEGERIAGEIERRMWSKAKWLGGLLGLTNLAALTGIYFGAVSAAEQAVTYRTADSLEILQQVVSEAQTKIGDARQLIGVTEGEMLSVQVRLNRINASLAEIDSDTSRIESAARLLNSIEENPNSAEILAQVSDLEKSTQGLQDKIASLSLEATYIGNERQANQHDDCEPGYTYIGPNRYLNHGGFCVRISSN